MNCGVYVIRNHVNGRCYVGSSSNIKKRLQEHRRLLTAGRHHCRYLQRAWSKTGSTGFEFFTLLVCSPENLLFYEQRALDRTPNKYNVALDAQANMRGRKHSRETRAKIAEYRRGRTASPEQKARQSSAMKVLWSSPDIRARRIQAHSAKLSSPEVRAKIAAGTKAALSSPEARANKAADMRRRWADPETRRHLSDAIKASLGKPEIKAKRSAAATASWKIRKAKEE